MGKVEHLFVFKIISFSVNYTSNPFSFLGGWTFSFQTLYILKRLILWGKIGNVFPILSVILLLSLVFFLAVHKRFGGFCLGVFFLCNEIFQCFPIFWVLGLGQESFPYSQFIEEFISFFLFPSVVQAISQHFS